MLSQSGVQPSAKTRTIKTVTTVSKSDDAFAIAIANNVGGAVSSMALPLAAVVIAYMFKVELSALLARLRSFKALGVEASLDALIQENLPPVSVSDQVPVLLENEQHQDTLDRAPIEVIASSWLAVESALRKATASLPGASTMSLRSRAASLASVADAPTGLVARVTELLNIRNRILHSPDAIISQDSLMLYEENARKASSQLLALTA